MPASSGAMSVCGCRRERSRNWNASSRPAELNRQATQEQVVLSGLSFKQQERSHTGLRQVIISGNLSGPYAGLMRYLNALERDPIFFQIQKVTLSLRQAQHRANIVRLHITLATYAREPQAAAAAVPNPEGQGLSTP